MQNVQLLSGFKIPAVGLGTWQSKDEEITTAVEAALEHGYRHFDTACNYNNEEAIGRSLKKWFDKGGQRQDLFITSKLPHYGNRPSDVEKFIKLTLARLQLTYLDMYLIHMPFAFIQNSNECVPAIEKDGSYKLELDTDPVSVWKIAYVIKYIYALQEMEKQVRNGNTKSIGLSNFNETQITEVWNNAEIKPSNLQIELHAYLQQKPLRQLCKKYNITITAYSPLASPGAKTHFQIKYNYSPDKFPDLLGHPVVETIATAHRKTTAQVLLRHLVQGGIVVIPKSATPQRIKENIQLFDFELTEEETNALDALDQGVKGRIFHFLFFKGVEKHPQYPFKNELYE